VDERPLDRTRESPDPGLVSGADTRYDELRVLANRHETGELSDIEYRQEKQRILHGRAAPTGELVEIIVARYSYEFNAEAALHELRKLQKDSTMQMINAAAVIKQLSGKVELMEVRELPTAAGARRGAIIGGIAGLISPQSSLAASTIDSAIGSALCRWTDEGFNTTDLQLIGKKLKPGQSAILAVVQNQRADDITHRLGGFATLTRYTLSLDLADAAMTEAEQDEENGW